MNRTRGMNVRRVVSSGGTERWEARYTDATGKVRAESYATEEAAVAAQAERKARKALDRRQDESKHLLPFAKYVEGWLEEKALSGIRPRTLEGYRDICRKYVLPALGDRPVGKVTTAVLQGYVNDLATKKSSRGYGFDPKTIRNMFDPVRQSLDHAARHGAIDVNPCGPVLMPRASAHPRPTKFEARPLTVAELASAYAALDERDPSGMDSFVARLLANTGFRAAELAGLEVGDVNIDNRTIRVVRTKQVVGTAINVGMPKSKRSTRTIPVPADFWPVLVAHLDSHPRGGEPTAPLVPARRPGQKPDSLAVVSGDRMRCFDWDRPLDPNSYLQRRWRPALTDAGLPPIRLHDLRHTYGTRLVAKDVPIDQVSHLMGHASIEITDQIYVHRDTSNLHHLVDLLD